MVGRKTITRTRTGTHSPCIQSGSTLFPSQAAFDHWCVGSTIEHKPAHDAPLKFQRNILQRHEASLRRLLVKCRLSAGRSAVWLIRSRLGTKPPPQKYLIVPTLRVLNRAAPYSSSGGGERSSTSPLAPSSSSSA